MSTHIGAEPGEIAERVLLPGDPLRAKWIAETYLKDARCYSTVRNMLGFTGTYEGVEVSVQGSGMGMPSAAIYAHELINDYGVRTLIRVGSCGALAESLKLRDVVAASGAATDSNMNRARFDGLIDYAPVADFQLLRKAVEVAEAHRKMFQMAVKMGVPIAMGTDTGVGEHGSNAEELALMVELGMTPMQAIVATTKTAAECSRIGALTGTLEPGKRADLIAVEGDPLTDVAVLQRADAIRLVMRDGRVFKQLDA